jgi:hypothetical protein
MKKAQPILSLLCCFLLLYSCSTGQYIHDTGSIERQKEMHRKRTGNNIGDVALQMLNIVTLASLNLDMEPETTPRSFKRIKLYNHSTDTMRVNLLTNVFWSGDEYNDILDVRIPPNEHALLMVPLGADYNIYFRDSVGGKDEMITINTADYKRIGLTPGMTLTGKNNLPGD